MTSRDGDDGDTAFGSSAGGTEGAHPGGDRPFLPEEALPGPELQDVTPGLEMVSTGHEAGSAGTVGSAGTEDRRFPRVAAEEDVPQQPLAERFRRPR